MKIQAFLLCASIAVGSLHISAQKPAWQPASGHPTLPLWANGAPGAPAKAPAEADMTEPATKVGAI